MKKHLLITLSAFLTPVLCCAKSGGETAAAFLTIDPGARYQAMGGAQVALTDGINADNLNPAALGYLKRTEVSASYLSYFEGVYLTDTALGIPVRSLGIYGLRYIMLNSGSITKTDDNASNIGSFTAQDAAIEPLWAAKVTDNLSVGSGLKYISQSIDDSNGGAFAIDAGVIYSALYDNRLDLGLVLRDFGKNLNDGPLPSAALFGLDIQACRQFDNHRTGGLIYKRKYDRAYRKRIYTARELSAARRICNFQKQPEFVQPGSRSRHQQILDARLLPGPGR